MKWRYKLFVGLLLFSLGIKAEVRVEKSFERVYATNSNTSLYMENKYGDLTLKNWDKDSVKIVCNYFVEAKNQEKLDKRLKGLDFKVYHSDVLVRMKTEIEGEISLSYALGDNGSLQVNYTVYLPENMPVKLKNKFGDIQLGNRSGKVDIELSHGDFTLGVLKGEADLELSNAEAYIYSVSQKLTMRLKYCDEIEVKKAKVINVVSSSSEVTIGDVSKLRLTSKRDRYQIKSVNELSGTGQMTKLSISYLKKSIIYDCSYGKYLNLDNVSKDFTSMNLNLKNTDLRLNFGEVNNFNLSVKHLDGELIYPKELLKFKTVFPEEKNEYTVSTVKIGDGKRPVYVKCKNSSLQFIKY